MTDSEHPTQEQYESCDLTAEQWSEVISKAEETPESDFYLYILRSLANQQVVTNASICAYKKTVVEEIQDRRTGSTSMGTITRWVRSVTGNPKAAFYEWNTIKGEWTIGYFQCASLRKAFGASCPKWKFRDRAAHFL